MIALELFGQLDGASVTNESEHESPYDCDWLRGRGGWCDIYAAASSKILEDQEGGRPLADFGRPIFSEQLTVANVRPLDRRMASRHRERACPHDQHHSTFSETELWDSRRPETAHEYLIS